MAEFRYDRANQLKAQAFLSVPEETDLACFNCGSKHPSAYWISEEDFKSSLIVCRSCAIRVLPRLMADAIAGQAKGGRPLWRDFLDHLKEIQLNYWLGVAAATERLNCKLRKEANRLFEQIHGPITIPEDDQDDE